MIPASVRIFVCTEPVDMRRGFDALALLTREKLSEDPRSGALAIFTNRRRDRLKALWWDRNGYCVLYKRFHDAVFEIPAAQSTGSVSIRIDGQKLAALLAGAPKVRKRAPKLRIVR
jgi:transposase